MPATRRFWLSVLLLGISISPAAFPAESHPGLGNEAAYAEAVIAYNDKRFDDSVKILDKLLQVSPENVPALELRALVLKAQGNEQKSLETYEELLKLKPENERGPYHFEAGVILYKAGKFAEAEPHFTAAKSAGFNKIASEFFLGMIEFNRGDLSSAAAAFDDVATNGGGELEVAAHYYLGLIDSKNDYGTGATHELIASRDAAAKIPDNKIAAQIGAAAAKALEPYNVSQWFGNVALLGGYNTNVALLSSTTSAPDLASGKSTGQTIVMAGLGRMSSPVDRLQWVASARSTYNYNFNTQTREYQFITFDPSLYLNANPLAKTSYGMKFEGTYTAQDQKDSGGSNYRYRPYSFAGETGPYVRSEIASRVQLTGQLFLRPHRYYGEPSGPDQRSGASVFAKASVQKDVGDRFFNPGADLSYEQDFTTGVNFRSKTVSLDLMDTMHLSGDDTVNLTAGTALSNYDQRDPKRFDSTVTLHANYLRSLTANWSLSGDVAYTNNTSTIAGLYSYTQTTAMAGLSYTF